jgi:hypothetical protein
MTEAQISLGNHLKRKKKRGRPNGALIWWLANHVLRGSPLVGNPGGKRGLLSSCIYCPKSTAASSPSFIL